MLSEKQVEDILTKITPDANEYPGMTYEQGVIDALECVLENTSLEEFVEQFEVPEDPSNF